ncbi:MAG: phage scaffolding protein [Lachnospiraceae bacterium]|nr:phage scaffolding protein [Lachnospiraceae bacterium]
MKLEELLGEELYRQVQEKIDAANAGQEDKLKHIRYADLSEGGYVSKGKFDDLQTDLTGKSAELEKANGLIEQLKKDAGKDSELQAKITAYEQEITELKAENTALKTDNALKFALKDAGAADIDYLVFKAKEKGEIKLDDDGKIKGIDGLIAGLKTQHPTQFASPDGNGRKMIDEHELPGSKGEKAVTKEKFLQMGYAERVRFKDENPELYKQYTNRK